MDYKISSYQVQQLGIAIDKLEAYRKTLPVAEPSLEFIKAIVALKDVMRNCIEPQEGQKD